MIIKVLGFIPITKNQFVFFEIFFFLFFVTLSFFLFHYEFPEYVNDPIVLFHAKYLKYVTITISFLIVLESIYYINKFIEKIKQIHEGDKFEYEIQEIDLIASIIMARRIQSTIFESSNQLFNSFDHFIINRPCDIVSGDFYLFKRIKDKDIIVAADCTGHSVEGALMSILGVTAFNEVFEENEVNLNSNEILDKLKKIVIESLILTQPFKSKQSYEKEGMLKKTIDLALLIIDKKNKTVQFSGAKNPLYIIRSELKGALPEDNVIIKKYIDLVPKGKKEEENKKMNEFKGLLLKAGNKKINEYIDLLIEKEEETGISIGFKNLLSKTEIEKLNGFIHLLSITEKRIENLKKIKESLLNIEDKEKYGLKGSLPKTETEIGKYKELLALLPKKEIQILKELKENLYKYYQVLYEIKADKLHIGIDNNKQLFKTFQFNYKEGDSLYIFSDGYHDQFGGDEEKTFSKKNFKKLLFETSNLPLISQKQKIIKAHEEWKGEYEQTDDILLIGIKL